MFLMVSTAARRRLTIDVFAVAAGKFEHVELA